MSYAHSSRRTLVRARAVRLALLVLVFTSLPASGEGPVAGFLVEGGADAAYHPGSLDGDRVVPSTTASYGGEPLRVQAVPIGRDAGEPTIAVDGGGVAFMSAATYDGVARLPRTRVMKSLDGGLTWSPTEPQLPGAGGPNPPATFDPYVYLDETTGRLFSIDLTLACSYLSFSDDQGASWTTNPLACGQPVNDHQTIVTGPPPEGLPTVGYANVLYYCFNRVSDAACSRSLDGGVTWAPTGAPSFLGYEVGDPYDKFGVPGLCGGLHGHIVTDAEGRLYVPKSHCGLPTLAVSEDGGTTWRRTVVDTALVTGAGHVGEHHSVAIDAAGNVYYLYWDDEHRLPWLAVSRDAGRTFGEPMMVAPPDVADVNMPTMVAGDEGKIAFQFPGTTIDDRNDRTRPWNTYVVVTENALDADPTFVSTTANPTSDPIRRGDCFGRCGGMLDFLDIITSPLDGGLWLAVTDTCTAEQDCVAVGQAGSSVDAEGVAVRQLSGPRIRTITVAGG